MYLLNGFLDVIDWSSSRKMMRLRKSFFVCKGILGLPLLAASCLAGILGESIYSPYDITGKIKSENKSRLLSEIFLSRSLMNQRCSLKFGSILRTFFTEILKILLLYNRGSRFLDFFCIFNFLQFAIDGTNNSKTKVEKVFFFIFCLPMRKWVF
jgi:hypothetical protein